MPRPRIAFWSPLLNASGGTETWFQTLFEHWDRRRAELLGLAVLRPEEFSPERAAALGRFAPVHCGPAHAAALALRCDVLVTWGIASLAGCLPPPGRRPKVVAVAHGDHHCSWTVSTLTACAADVDRFVAVSAAALEAVPAGRRDDAVVLWNGVDPKRLEPRLSRPEQLQAWGLPADAWVLGYLGRLSEEKRPEMLCRTVRHLPAPWFGVAVGDGPDGPSVRADGLTWGLGRVRFPGATEDVGSSLHAMDALIVPSETEGFGLQIIEAWTVGVPVYAGPVGIAREFPELVGRIALDADGPAIARAVLEDQGSREIRAWRGLSAQNRFLASFTERAFADRWHTFFEGLHA